MEYLIFVNYFVTSLTLRGGGGITKSITKRYFMGEGGSKQ